MIKACEESPCKRSVKTSGHFAAWQKQNQLTKLAITGCVKGGRHTKNKNPLHNINITLGIPEEGPERLRTVIQIDYN